PVAVLVPDEVTGQDRGQGLAPQVAVERGPLLLRPVAGPRVVLRVDERLAQRCRHAHADGRHAVLLAVDALGVLPQRGLDGHVLPDHHLVDDAAPRLHRRGQAADRVRGARLADRARDAAAQCVLEAQLRGVDRVEGAQLRTVDDGPLVRVVAGPALAVLVDAQVAVGLDEPRRQHHPDPSTTVREPSCGTATSAAVPTCAIRPSRTSITPSSIGAARFPSASATGRMRAPTTARSRTAGTGMERYTATPGMWGGCGGPGTAKIRRHPR